MAMTPERKVDAALNARSAWPILPCWIGLGLFGPGLVKFKPALSLSLTTEGAFVDPGADGVLFGLLIGLAAVVEATEGAFFGAVGCPVAISSCPRETLLDTSVLLELHIVRFEFDGRVDMRRQAVAEIESGEQLCVSS